MMYDLIRVGVTSLEADTFYFYPFFILCHYQTPFITALHYYEELLNDDHLWRQAQQDLFEVGRITLSQEQVETLKLEVGIV